jgi:hypothetical protein
MSGDAIFIIGIFAMIPTLIIVATVVKLWEVRQARSWPETTGTVLVSRVQATKKTPGDPGYNTTSGSNISNEPLVEYEYQVGNRNYRCRRITIGEKTSEYEIEEILARYPVGAIVTVYYNPANPQKAVLERDVPLGKLAGGLGCLMLFFVGGPLLAAYLYFNGVAWFTSHLARPDRAPFVAAVTGFGLLCALFALALIRMTQLTARWPVARGRIVASGVEAYHDWHEPYVYRRRKLYKSVVVYEYEVKGQRYRGDRLTLGMTLSSTLTIFARRAAAKYPVGMELDVHYNPINPGESVIHARSHAHLLLWFMAAVTFALAWAVGSGTLK